MLVVFAKQPGGGLKTLIFICGGNTGAHLIKYEYILMG
jgi:hypothetical protein